jgi:uncharacterized membrane protein
VLEYPLNADVLCTDGHAGKSTHVLFDPKGRTVSHIVVKPDSKAGIQDRLVPVEHVTATNPTTIQLNCTQEELSKMAPFSESHFVAYTYQDYSSHEAAMVGPSIMPMNTTATTEIVDEMIPEGLRAIAYGATVQATDGAVGNVEELLVDPDSGVISHFTLQTGHFWGKKDITLPVSAVDFVEENIIYLKLDKKAIESLPAVPHKHKAQTRLELIARVFDDTGEAAKTLEFLKDLQRRQRGALKIRNSAIIVKDQSGKLTVTDSGDLSPRKGTWMGAVAGGLLGALAGPVGIVVGAAAGAGVGRVSTRWIDLGFPDEFLTQLQSYLKPGSSALVILIEDQYVHQLSESLADLKGVVLQHTLTDEVVNQLLEEDKSKQ